LRWGWSLGQRSVLRLRGAAAESDHPSQSKSRQEHRPGRNLVDIFRVHRIVSPVVLLRGLFLVDEEMPKPSFR
jgi:hypothetical protein